VVRHAVRVKGFRGHVAEDLFSVARIDRFAFDVELFYVALKRNYDIKRLRVQEGSSVRVVRDGLTMVRDLGSIRLHQLLGHYAPTKPVILGVDTAPVPDADWAAGGDPVAPLRRVK
jgi:hypothetical protein